MSSHPHEHTWQFTKKFIGAGKPVLKHELVNGAVYSLDDELNVEPVKIKTWVDCRHTFAEFICECGELKQVNVK